MPAVERDGAKLSYRLAGQSDASPVLLIHGLGANMAFWHPLLVGQLGENRQLVMYDQRGHGYSTLTPSGYTSLELAHDALCILDELKVPLVDVVAHSFGASVALQVIRLAPERVGNLTILDGRVRLLQPVQRLRDWEHWKTWWRYFEAAGVEVDDQQELDFSLLAIMADPRFADIRMNLEADGFFVPFGSWNAGRRSAAKWRKLIDETTAPRDFQDHAGITAEILQSIQQPSFLLYGEYSHCLPTREGLVAHLPDVRGETLPAVGHNFPVLRPRETAQQIESFWKTVGQSAGASS